MPAVQRSTLILTVSLLLCACAGPGTAGADAQVPAAPLPFAGLPPLPESREAQAIDPAYFPGTQLINYLGQVQLLPEGLGLGADEDGLGYDAFGLFCREDGEQVAAITFSTLPAAGQSSSGPYWLGLGNYSLGAWEWHGPYTALADSLSLGNPQDYLSPWGHIYIALLTSSGNGCIVTNVGVTRAPGTEPPAPPPDSAALCVGPGQPYASIEAAYAAAQPGDHIKIYPQPDVETYNAPALLVDKPGLSFWGMRGADNQRPRLFGQGFDYSGAGSVPRAMFQFQPGADGCALRGLEMFEAHNSSYNGAAVRVNQAKGILIEDCVIYGCDMGLMSNGDASAGTGEVTLLECRLYANGNEQDPGYNHNIYAGGTRLRMQGCEVYGSLTGHNVKSRAHINEIVACYIHDSSNRELDLVDEAGNTDIADSYSLISGCVIEKAADLDGNRGVIHFGQDGGGDHNGTLYLCNNTIATPYISPVVQLSAPNARLAMYNCILWDAGSGENNHPIVEASGGAVLGNASGGHNWLSFGFRAHVGTNFDLPSMYFAEAGVDPPFADSAGGDYRLLPAAFEFIVDAGVSEFFTMPEGEGGAPLSIVPDRAYRPDFCTLPRPLYGDNDIGAYESEYGK